MNNLQCILLDIFPQNMQQLPRKHSALYIYGILTNALHAPWVYNTTIYNGGEGLECRVHMCPDSRGGGQMEHGGVVYCIADAKYYQ